MLFLQMPYVSHTYVNEQVCTLRMPSLTRSTLISCDFHKAFRSFSNKKNSYIGRLQIDIYLRALALRNSTSIKHHQPKYYMRMFCKILLITSSGNVLIYTCTCTCKTGNLHKNHFSIYKAPTLYVCI